VTFPSSIDVGNLPLDSNNCLKVDVEDVKGAPISASNPLFSSITSTVNPGVATDVNIKSIRGRIIP